MHIYGNINLADVLNIVSNASRAVLDLYNKPEQINIEYKQDKSPVTNADIVAHNIIFDGLSKLDESIPIVSEEQPQEISVQIMQNDIYWIVDPIDGTKDFINRTDQFTVCVALIVNTEPYFGIVSAPALSAVYYGGKSFGSFVINNNQPSTKISATSSPKVVYAGHTGTNNATEQYINEHYPTYELVGVGSQLKFAYIAEGKGAVYPRIGSTMSIWDLAPGHAIVEGAGGIVTRPDGTPITYDGQSLLAGNFVAKSHS
jgi:3'(2'), 5'-bisphosphate nucleotidase